MGTRALRVGLVSGAMLLSVAACANGSMGLGLEEFPFEYWFAYVAATLVMEAWFIGGKLGYKPIPAFLVSLLANFVTGFCCAGGMLAPFLHGLIYTNPINPNPLLYAVLLIGVFAVPSGAVESVVWVLGRRFNNGEPPKDGAVFWRCIQAHLIGIPLALVILLIPSHPYAGLERRVALARSRVIGKMGDSLQAMAVAEGRVPDLGSQSVVRELVASAHSPDAWAALYGPDLRRFDIGEARRRPLTWNRSLSGRKLGSPNDDADVHWLLRDPDDPHGRGLSIDLSTGQVSYRLLVDVK